MSNPIYYILQDELMRLQSWAIETHNVTPGECEISFNGFPYKASWYRFWIGAIGELAYSIFRGIPFDWEHKFRFTVLDFNDGAQVKSTTGHELVIPKYEWNKKEKPKFYVLALVKLFDVEPYKYAKVELAGKISRFNANKLKTQCTLPNVGNDSWQIDRKHLLEFRKYLKDGKFVIE